MLFGYFILLISVVISAIAAYYSVVGLTAIFAAAVIPVMIMGGALEAGKIVATVWLHNNWRRAGIWFKLYLVPAIVFLMLLTSMGIFGFLSKAHSDQSLISGDALSKIAIYDEKIKTARDNIETNRKALQQMDAAVDQIMGRSSDEKGADKAVATRRSQQKERARLLAEISAEQKTIAALNEEAAPIRAENRKIEAEVGPIKYIAALIYGDNPDQNLLEAAVRWVIILIVIVFDPLALTLILAGNKQLQWARAGKGGWAHEDEEEHVPPENKQGFSFFEFEKKDKDETEESKLDPVEEKQKEEQPAVEDYGNCPKCNTALLNAPGIGPFCPNKECDVVDGIHSKVEFTEEQKEQTIEEFFDRARLVARELDREEEQRKIDEANALLAEVTEPDSDPEQVAADAEQLQALELQQAELQAALDTLVEKYDELAAEKDNLVIEKQDAEQQASALQQDLDQAQLRLIEAQTENTTLSNAVVEIAQEQAARTIQIQELLSAKELELAAIRLRIEELERVEEPTEMASDVVELEQPVITQLNNTTELVTAQPVTLEDSAVQLSETAPIERPGDYLVPPRENAQSTSVANPLRRGIQSNFQYMKASRNQTSGTVYTDDIPESGKAGFGTRFPETAGKGDMFLRVDMMPNRAYKYNGSKWIEVDKNKTDRFAYDDAYIQHLAAGLSSGEYDLDDLNDTERAQLEQFRNKGTLL
jgi:hypothetical protein